MGRLPKIALFVLLPLSGCLENTVRVNFRNINGTKLSKRYFYLPPTSGVDDSVVDEFGAKYLDNSYFEQLGFQRIFGNKELYRGENELHSGFVRIGDMACENSASAVHFKASLLTHKNSDHPIIETANADTCKVEKLTDNSYQVNFSREQFANCGVVDCSDTSGVFYCLTLRFPSISGLKLKEDLVVTLQCKPKERVASQVKQVSVKSLDTSARMAPRVVRGGYKNSFETDVGLYRRTFDSGNAFDVRVNSGGTVILGEQLLLRVVVREGDGWRYSKMAEVKVHQIEKTNGQKARINGMLMVNSNGCVNPLVRDICPNEQYKTSPLESYLLFEAFMFENMKDNDEMVLSVRAIGCVDGTDCALNCPASHLRKSRSLGNHNRTTDWKSDVSFRVVTVDQESLSGRDNYVYFTSLLIYTLSCLIVVFILIMIYILSCFIKRKNVE